VRSIGLRIRGFLEKSMLGAHNNTHKMAPKYYDGTRRPARELTQQPLKMLKESVIISQIEVYLLGARNIPPKYKNFKAYVRLFHVLEGMKVVVEEGKTKTKRNSVTPEFNESFLLDVPSNDVKVQIELRHKRKPAPSKALGSIEFDLNDIYKLFDGVDQQKLPANSVRELLKTQKKRYEGSILDDLFSRHSRSTAASDVSLGEDSSPGSRESQLNPATSELKTKESAIPRAIPKTMKLKGAFEDVELQCCIRFINDIRR